MNSAESARNQHERFGADRNAVIESRVDQILAAEERLLPSSGFLASVMERVQEEALATPPIAFPWRRAFPGAVLAICVFGWGGFEMIHFPFLAASPIQFTLPPLSATILPAVESAGWVALALGASLLSWLLSRRLAGQGGLL
ncbi:MAG: hypothetical protein ABR907_01475 [Terracidiphilus sp.]